MDVRYDTSTWQNGLIEVDVKFFVAVDGQVKMTGSDA